MKKQDREITPKNALDSITKIIVQALNDSIYFVIGVQFKDFGQPYTDYSGRFSKRCMAHSDLFFVIHLFYHLSSGMSLEASYDLARKTDDETGLYEMYSK